MDKFKNAMCRKQPGDNPIAAETDHAPNVNSDHLSCQEFDVSSFVSCSRKSFPGTRDPYTRFGYLIGWLNPFTEPGWSFPRMKDALDDDEDDLALRIWSLRMRTLP